MRQFILLVLTLTTISCQTDNEFFYEKTTVPVDNIKLEKVPTSHFETYEVDVLGWGYKIFQDGKMLINQPHIPSIQGNKRFSSRFKAAIAAKFILNKIDNNIFPPSISPSELDSLGVLD
ncbi:MAG: DUF4907 domain-containing protein [Crocinitomicaceae bacterium]